MGSCCMTASLVTQLAVLVAVAAYAGMTDGKSVGHRRGGGGGYRYYGPDVDEMLDPAPAFAVVGVVVAVLGIVVSCGLRHSTSCAARAVVVFFALAQAVVTAWLAFGGYIFFGALADGFQQTCEQGGIPGAGPAGRMSCDVALLLFAVLGSVCVLWALFGLFIFWSAASQACTASARRRPGEATPSKGQAPPAPAAAAAAAAELPTPPPPLPPRAPQQLAQQPMQLEEAVALSPPFLPHDLPVAELASAAPHEAAQVEAGDQAIVKLV